MHREISNFRQQQQHAVSIRILSASLIAVGIGLSGCASYQSGERDAGNVTTAPVSKRPVISWPGQRVAIPVPEKIPKVKAYQHEIVRLKQLLAEKEKFIQDQANRELNPAQTQRQTMQEPASAVSQTKSQQYRLATKPEAASKIAEVEVSLGLLKQSSAAKRHLALLSLAQSLLDAALLTYEHTDYSNAMSYAAQSQECTKMLAKLTEKSYEQQPSTMILRTPILLQIRKSELLKTAPGDTAEIQGTLARDTAVTATSYHGQWLRIETRDGRSGWIRNQSIDARINLSTLPGQESGN